MTNKKVLNSVSVNGHEITLSYDGKKFHCTNVSTEGQCIESFVTYSTAWNCHKGAVLKCLERKGASIKSTIE